MDVSHLRNLEKGWNGYDADPPSEDALSRAEAAIALLLQNGITPTRIIEFLTGVEQNHHRKFLELPNA